MSFAIYFLPSGVEYTNTDYFYTCIYFYWIISFLYLLDWHHCIRIFVPTAMQIKIIRTKYFSLNWIFPRCIIIMYTSVEYYIDIIYIVWNVGSSIIFESIIGWIFLTFICIYDVYVYIGGTVRLENSHYFPPSFKSDLLFSLTHFLNILFCFVQYTYIHIYKSIDTS